MTITTQQPPEQAPKQDDEPQIRWGKSEITKSKKKIYDAADFPVTDRDARIKSRGDNRNDAASVDTGILLGSEQEGYRQTAGGQRQRQARTVLPSRATGEASGVATWEPGREAVRRPGRAAERLPFPFPSLVLGVERAQAQFYQIEVEGAQAYFTASDGKLGGEDGWRRRRRGGGRAGVWRRIWMGPRLRTGPS